MFEQDPSDISKLKSPNWILNPQTQGGVAMQVFFCPRQDQGSEHNLRKLQVAKILPSKPSLTIMIRENYTGLEYRENEATGAVLHHCHRSSLFKAKWLVLHEDNMLY